MDAIQSIAWVEGEKNWDLLRNIEYSGAARLMTKNHFITGDECSIYWDNYLCGQWTADRAAISPRIHITTPSKKTIISVYFTRQGFVSVEALPETERFNFTFLIEIILLNIVQFVNVFRPKMQGQSYWMHIDNVQSHNSALSIQKTEELGFTRLAQSPYSPDLAPCDFFLFGYLNKELHGKNFMSQNEVISVVKTFWSKSLFKRSHESLTNGSRDYIDVVRMRWSLSK
jgi:hypothetical protein